MQGWDNGTRLGQWDKAGTILLAAYKRRKCLQSGKAECVQTEFVKPSESLIHKAAPKDAKMSDPSSTSEEIQAR